MAVFISVMPFPKSRVESVGTSLARLSIRAPTHTGTAISLVRPTLSKQARPMFAALTAVLTDQPLPSAWGI